MLGLRRGSGAAPLQPRRVRLLFDENISSRLTGLLQNEFPGSIHVRDVELVGTSDVRIWEYARIHGFAIVSKDDDFRQRSFLQGPPPKVVWLQVGNAGTVAIADMLRAQAARIRTFESEPESALLIVRGAV